MFVAGPPVVARLGEKVTKEELGGTEIHARNGAVDDEVESEDEAFARTRRFLSYLPSSIDGLAERQPSNDDPNRREASLIDAIPRDRRKVYRIRPIVEACVDRGSLLRDRQDVGPLGRHRPRPGRRLAGRGAGERSVLLWRRLDDRCQPQGHALRRLRRDLPSAGGALRRHPGLRDRRRRREGRHHPARRAGAAAVYQSKAPWCSILLRKSFGVRGAAHQNWQKYNFRYAWPSGDWGSLPLEGRHRGRLQGRARGAPDPAAHLAAIEARLNKVRSPFRTPSASASRRSSTRATRGGCSASSPTSPRRCASPGPRSFGYRP
jgi:propionyl-CoA carboxylase beta chain